MDGTPAPAFVATMLGSECMREGGRFPLAPIQCMNETQVIDEHRSAGRSFRAAGCQGRPCPQVAGQNASSLRPV
jgi:hypothetical protein